MAGWAEIPETQNFVSPDYAVEHFVFEGNDDCLDEVAYPTESIVSAGDCVRRLADSYLAASITAVYGFCELPEEFVYSARYDQYELHALSFKTWVADSWFLSESRSGLVHDLNEAGIPLFESRMSATFGFTAIVREAFSDCLVSAALNPEFQPPSGG
jgi:hypothetical protein